MSGNAEDNVTTVDNLKTFRPSARQSVMLHKIGTLR
jgi:hypothetical protein